MYVFYIWNMAWSEMFTAFLLILYISVIHAQISTENNENEITDGWKGGSILLFKLLQLYKGVSI